MGGGRTFEDLEAWQACRAFRIFVFREVITKLIAKKEFDHADNLKRAARSTTNNIAEGHGRFHYLDNYRFCSISRGSLSECLDDLISANDEGSITDGILSEGRCLHDNALRLLNGHMAYLKRSADTSSATAR